MDTSQYMSMFLEESLENLQTLNESLLDLEQNPEDTDKVNAIFRVAHTIKSKPLSYDPKIKSCFLKVTIFLILDSI